MARAAKVAICLFRNDLRVRDNELLARANSAAAATHILPIFVVDPRQYHVDLLDSMRQKEASHSGSDLSKEPTTWHFGFPKCHTFRSRFLMEGLADLQNNLHKLGSGLMVLAGRPEDVVPTLVSTLRESSYDVSSVLLQQETTYEEVSVERMLGKALFQVSVPLTLFWGSTMYHKDDLPYRDLKIELPLTYTTFLKRIEKEGTLVRKPFEVPKRLLPLPQANWFSPSLSPFGFKNDPLQSIALHPDEKDRRSAFPFTGGESSGLQRVQSYLFETEGVKTYKETRNGLIGTEYSSKLSPFLALGFVSPRTVYYELLRYERTREKNQSTYHLWFELLWRDFFKFISIKIGNGIFYLNGGMEGEGQGQAYGGEEGAKPVVPSSTKKAADVHGRSSDKKEQRWATNKTHFEVWKEGKTGIPWVDANMRELNATGFMSNRGRQNVASFLAKSLGIDWRLGAEYFESLLIDHDPSSNYGNWQYASGVGHLDPRENRKFNQIKQAKDYDPEGAYIRLWVPELKDVPAKYIHSPWLMNILEQSAAGVRLGDDYPRPIIVEDEWKRHYSSYAGTGRDSRQQDRRRHRGHRVSRM